MQYSTTSKIAVNTLAENVCQEYRSKFGGRPSVVTAAPGRVNVIGEHIDYNDGFVLPMAIDRYVVMAASRRSGEGNCELRLHSVNLKEDALLSLNVKSSPQSEGWARYIEGVVAGFMDRGFDVPPMDIVLKSNIPIGGGLSSSAALEVATATLFESLIDHKLDLTDKALLCQQAEHRFAGVPCGIMDQFASVFGRKGELMLIDCQSQRIEPVPLACEDITLLICNSNVQHQLSGGEYATRRTQCDVALCKLGHPSWRDVTLQTLLRDQSKLTEIEMRRSRHVVSEICRTQRAAHAMHQNDWNTVGHLMYESHTSLRDDFEVSCVELDLLVDLTRELGESAGVFGSRMTGGGFGGCTVTLLHTENVAEVSAHIVNQYEKKTGIKPSSFTSRPARGAYTITE